MAAKAHELQWSHYMSVLPLTIIYFICGLLLGSFIGFLVALLISQQSKAKLHTDKTLLEEKIKDMQSLSEQYSDRFATLSNQALQKNNESFLKLAEENLKKHQAQANNELDKKEKSIENLLKPIREALDKTSLQIHEIEKERKEAFGSLSQHLKLMAETQSKLHSETQSLVSALKRPEVRGQWGELTLKRLAELAGMVQYCDFYEQESISSADGLFRPDMIVRMPDNRELVVDAKTSLDAYLKAMQTEDKLIRQTELERHARKMRDRIKELASKAYWAQFKNSPDFVILFVPGDHFLSAAQEQDPSLLEYALSNKVIPSTPTSLIALLRAVAFGWRQQAVAKNAEKIQTLGEDLHSRIAIFADHISKLGKSLGTSIEHYNSAVGSLERNVLPGARKFIELGIESKKNIDKIDPIEKIPRKIFD